MGVCGRQGRAGRNQGTGSGTGMPGGAGCHHLSGWNVHGGWPRLPGSECASDAVQCGNHWGNTPTAGAQWYPLDHSGGNTTVQVLPGGWGHIKEIAVWGLKDTANLFVSTPTRLLKKF